MNIFCLPRFKKEYEKIKGKKSHKTIEQDIINYFFNKSTNLISGIRLNNNKDAPFLKKRLKGSGGFRFYFLVIIKDNNLYLAFIHPKTGVYGADNIKNEFKAQIQKETYNCIRENDLYQLSLSESKNKIEFKLKEHKIVIIDDESKVK